MQSDMTLVGIHHGAIGCGRRQEKIQWPSWWVRVSNYVEWIDCTLEYASEGLKTHFVVQAFCNQRLGYPTQKPILPNCDHVELFPGEYINDKWISTIPNHCQS